jgi:serine/threonine protein kinase
VHRDIKPQNILISKDQTKVILVDFNVAKAHNEDEDILMYTSGAGTLSFAAPERITNAAAGYTEKVDVWAAGIVLVMLLTGEHPFDEGNGSATQVMNCIIDGEDICREFLNEHDEISEEVKDLAMTMVRMDPNARPSCAEALEHPWFSKNDFYQTMLETTKSRLVVRKDAKLADPEEFRLKENLNMS